LDVGKIKAGETLVVSGAAGSVGSLACQIGKIYGAKVIGIAGTDEKCRWLKEELKIDAALNYKSPAFRDEFKNAVGYLDVFFDNVGGEILDFALTRLRKGARIALCGESNHDECCCHAYIAMDLLIGAISDYSTLTIVRV
jgi:NADPH-dependent curcumin reductase CurA